MKISTSISAVLILIFTSPLFAQERVVVGGTVINDGFLDVSTISFETRLALATMLGMDRGRLEADIPDFETGDVFQDKRNKADYISKILEYADQFRAIQDKHNGIWISIDDRPLVAGTPDVDSNGTVYVGSDLYDAYHQEVCGLPGSIVMSRSGSDLSSDGYIPASYIYIRYPSPVDYENFKMAHVETNEWCGQSRDAAYTKIAPNGSLGLQWSDAFYYVFINLDLGESMYNIINQKGAVADTKCVVNAITREPEVDLVCNLYSLSIETSEGGLIYSAFWNGSTYENKWGAVDPTQRN